MKFLVKMRLGVLRDLCSEYKLALSVQSVCSDKHKTDYLAIMPKRWFDASTKKSTGCVSIKAIGLHDVHHLGIDRTPYLAKLEDPEVTRGKVADVINSCTQCQSIDLAPQNWDKEHLYIYTSIHTLCLYLRVLRFAAILSSGFTTTNSFLFRFEWHRTIDGTQYR